MTNKVKLAVAGLALVAGLIGGGAAAWAQSTTTPSTTAPSTTAPANPGAPAPDARQPHSSANCPNMGQGAPGGTAPRASSSSYPGV